MNQKYYLLSFTLKSIFYKKSVDDLQIRDYTVLENRSPIEVLRDIKIQQDELSKKHDFISVISNVFYAEITKEEYENSIDVIGSYYARD